MKKIKVWLLGILVTFIVPISVNAESYTFDDMTCELDDNYNVTVKENIDTATYIPLEYSKEELIEFFDKGEYSLFALNEDDSNLRLKISTSSECGNMATDEEEMNQCMPDAISELKEKEETDLVNDDTFISKNGIRYYTLEYFKFGSTILNVTTSYNNVVYTFTLATSNSMEDIETHAKEIMDSVTLNGFEPVSENTSNDLKENKKTENEEESNMNIVVIGVVLGIIAIGGISIYVYKKKNK